MSNSTIEKPQLHYLVRNPKIKTEKPPLLILLHGVGSNDANMFSFADSLPDKFLVVSARGPLTFGPGSYAWFQVDFSTGRPVINENQAEAARKTILKFIKDLKSEQNFDENEVYLLGFSQGGIMSYSVALTEPEKIKGIAVMSGRLLPEVKPLVASPERLKKLQIFISHGKEDQVLHYPFATDAVSYLDSLGLHPDFHTYHDNHTINPDMLHDAVQWLNSVQ
ncbi:alpha/beta hydrolase [Rhizosphaericola mali]|uniref:alpha/beta hydrolase n=1 Tax=Rhizosphaericola mali TaxID=2545455 RepID=UPI001CDA3CA0|nr:alpha/beta fold hydrolase [Rhizosphaericola mali]